jgi:hypothetical protein
MFGVGDAMHGLIGIANAVGWMALACIAVWMVVAVTFRLVAMLAAGGMP